MRTWYSKRYADARVTFVRGEVDILDTGVQQRKTLCNGPFDGNPADKQNAPTPLLRSDIMRHLHAGHFRFPERDGQTLSIGWVQSRTRYTSTSTVGGMNDNRAVDNYSITRT